MRYLCVVYIDPALFDAMSPDEADRLDDEAMAMDQDLERSGHLILAQALEHPRTAVTLRRRDGRLSTTDGPFAETHEHLGGFFYIEARDLNEAIDIAARSPLTRVGAVEVRPTFDLMQKIATGHAAMPDQPATIAERIEAIYWTESRRVLATLIRLLGDFDLAEEALQDAFLAATEQWPRDGEPANPGAWLVSAGRFRAIDHLRRRARFDAALGELAARLDDRVDDLPTTDAESVQDDQLRLIFTCCHPALPPDAQVAMALRTVCGLTTEEIARAFLTGAPTVAQRIVRAKARIRAERIPYEVPSGAALAPRLDAVLRVISLVYTEGYAASSGAEMVRQDLSDEAIRMGRLLVDLLPDPEALGLLALMLFGDARRDARVSPTGDLVLLADQDRSRWDRQRIDEASRILAGAVDSGTIGPFMLQAAIAEAHTTAPTADATDWPRIISLYDLLLELDPSPVVALNRAVAVAMREGPTAGLTLIERILAGGELRDYHLARSAQADLLRRSGRVDEARVAYEAALGLTLQDRERRFLEGRLRGLADEPRPTG